MDAETCSSRSKMLGLSLENKVKHFILLTRIVFLANRTVNVPCSSGEIMLSTSISGAGTGGTGTGCLSVAGTASRAVENAVPLGELHLPVSPPHFQEREWK